AIGGNTMDNLNNELLRSPIDAMNSTIQFFIDHRGEDIPSADIRRMHLASLRTVEDWVTPERKFIISGYDKDFGDVQVLVRFQNAWTECEVFIASRLDVSRSVRRLNQTFCIGSTCICAKIPFMVELMQNFTF